MRSFKCAFALAFVFVSGSASAQADTLTANDVIQRYIAARGGIDAIHAIRTMVLHGPPRPNGKPGRTMTRARPAYLSIGTEGSDGSPWEGYDAYGLRIRVTDAPAAALRHTAYFDDPLIMAIENKWPAELTGSEVIEGRPAYRIRVVFPDGFVTDCFVDKESWLLTARRATAPNHAFGDAVTGEVHYSDYRRLSTGALFPYQLRGVDLATGRLGEPERWDSIEVNVALPSTAFDPPPVPDTPVARMLNAAYRARYYVSDALLIIHDFQRDPATEGIDLEGALESLAYQCLKNGATPTGLAIMRETLRAHPQSARAHFGMGRALRASGRDDEATLEFREALRLDPNFDAAKQALVSRVLPY